jgi:hypothetical protein
MKQLWQLVPKMFKSINTPYHITVVNEELNQESLQLPLTKKSLFLFFSSIMVGIFLLFSIFIFVSPLKYYLPGYNVDQNRKQILLLKKSTDSLIVLNQKREAYIVNLVQVIKGETIVNLDTNRLSQSNIQTMQAQELASIKSANALRKTLPPPPKKDTLAAIEDSITNK